MAFLLKNHHIFILSHSLGILLRVIEMIENLTKHNISFTTEYCKNNMTVPVVYSDDYLRNEMLDLNLARLCCTLCCCSYDENILKKALTDAEFTHIKAIYTTPKENTASLCIARKGKNVFIIIRGTEGEEWYNNFRTGMEDTHQGYYDTVKFLKPLLNDYIQSDYRLLFTGHSRGGALSNLLASDLIKSGRENVFAYTFASPNVTTKDEVYSHRFCNIYNFVYEDDFITHCPLREWGYNRYGNTIRFKTQEINYKKLKKSFKELTGIDFVTFRDCGEMVDTFIDTALRLASNPYEYYNKGYLVDESYLTLYDYFQTICDVFTDNNSFDAGITLLATKLSSFAPISNFLVSGIDIPSLLSQGNAENSCAMFAHSCLTYLCLLNTQKIKAP